MEGDYIHRALLKVLCYPRIVYIKQEEFLTRSRCIGIPMHPDSVKLKTTRETI
jgi:hypothetical protein